MEEFKNQDNVNKIPLIAIVGPTASGKTSLAIEIAKKYNAEIVSADSMQIYKGMDIATAKPTKEEMSQVKHHLVGYVDVTQSYSVGAYVEKAKEVINEISGRGKLPLLVGGTGLYVNTLLNNIELPQISEDIKIREELYKKLEDNGIESLLEELKTFDEESANRLLENLNSKRVIRAIEIYRVTGVNMTTHLQNSKLKESAYNDVRIGLKCFDRENLYKRINLRVDKMIEQGLLLETEKVLSTQIGQTSKMAIGYKELKPYFDNEMTLEEAVENLKRETRRYAKRQLTWFKKDDKINWIDIDIFTNLEEIIKKSEEIINNKFNLEVV